MTHPGVNRIFRIALAGGKVTEAATGDSLENPNGIPWDRQQPLSCSRRSAARTCRRGRQARRRRRSPTARASTTASRSWRDGRILVSSWADSSIYSVRDGKMSKIVSRVSAPADIGVDSKRGVLAIPRFDQNQVEFWKIP